MCKVSFGKEIWIKCQSLQEKIRNRKNENTYDIDFDFLNLEAKNDGPDETKDQPGVSINNILRAYTLQPDLNHKAVILYSSVNYTD